MRNEEIISKFDVHTSILSNEKVAEDHYLLRCECSEIAQHALARSVCPRHDFDTVTGLLLRRPFTIYTVDDREITMLYQIIGEGTQRLSDMPKGPHRYMCWDRSEIRLRSRTILNQQF